MVTSEAARRVVAELEGKISAASAFFEASPPSRPSPSASTPFAAERARPWRRRLVR